MSRRYQVPPPFAYCDTCRTVVSGPQSPAVEGDARAHATTTGHEVRITQTRLIIIAPQAAGAAVR
jgi:hypothetical protein